MQNSDQEQNFTISPEEMDRYLARGRALRAQAVRDFGRQIASMFSHAFGRAKDAANHPDTGSAPAR
ncbi:hypothetical protein KHP62_07140 [Rhodobacteraceae bacterium NNCM2]|nr:hypothetical protein [Coraliihabitans acroporae]